jgi:hypothetical protein
VWRGSLASKHQSSFHSHTRCRCNYNQVHCTTKIIRTVHATTPACDSAYRKVTCAYDGNHQCTYIHVSIIAHKRRANKSSAMTRILSEPSLLTICRDVQGKREEDPFNECNWTPCYYISRQCSSPLNSFKNNYHRSRCLRS